VKEYPELDFRVHVAPLALEFAPSAAAFFEDCFAITLNTRIRLLWVPTQQHSACVGESRALASMISGVHDHKRRSQLPHGELAQVLQGIIGSAHFSNDHRVLIGLP
jgi:hypothetical protein